MQTRSTKPAEVDKKWYVIDGEGLVVGRLATIVALRLRGKHKPIYAPHLDTGDHVIVVNASKVVLTSDKAEKKVAHRHTGYPGGLRTTSYTDLMARRPEEVVRKAVKGMLPKNRLGRSMLRKLKVYAGPDHPHAAQLPTPLDLVSARARQD